MVYHSFYREDVAWIEATVREGVRALPAGRPLYAGLYLPEQARSFPGRTGAGHIFKMNSLLSACLGTSPERPFRAADLDY